MILCVGVTGSGKTMLLRQLQEQGQNLVNIQAAKQDSADVVRPIPKISTAQTSVPTIGTDLIVLSR